MDLFDLHCDTAFECAITLNNTDICKGAKHISLNRGGYLSKWRQIFAVFMPDEYRGDKAVAHYNRVRDYIYRQAEKFPEKFRIVTDSAQFHEDFGGCNAIMSVEGGSALAGKIERVQSLYDDGVRLMTLTWNAANEIADGIRAESGGGLTAFGFDVLAEMNRLRMVVDVSHLSDEGFYDVAECSKASFVASHSNARSLCGNKRNLTDDMIDIISSRGGLIGLNFYREFLRNDGDAHMADIINHTEYMLARGCEDCLCLGSDFDGCDIALDMTGIESMADLYETFLRLNYSENLVRNIFSGNAERYFNINVF